MVVDDADEPAAKRQRAGDAGDAASRPTPSREPALAPSPAAGPLPALPEGEEDWLPLGDAPGALPPRWAAALGGELCKAYFTSLRRFLFKEAVCSGAKVFPPAREVFSAFHSCDLDKVRVVILGQDPYHDFGQAHGLAFSVKPGVSPLPPSLRNMLTEVGQDPKLPHPAGGARAPPHGCLTHWADQGVLLLNTCLTVRAHQANSHQQQGWEQFTDAVVRAISERLSGVVFLLWGLPAQKKGACVAKTKHVIIKCSHPSPLSANRPASGNPAFMGSRCFSRCNDELAKRGKGPPIDWTIPA